MDKETLEKEATEYAQKLGVKDFIAKPKEIVAYFGYLAGAEPREKQIADLEKKVGRYQTGMFDEIEKRDKKLTEALKHLKDLVYVVELGKNELATARILAEVKQFLSEVEK